MPPKPKITREMVVDAVLDLIREGGVDAVTVRAVASRLGCSTQPVMYHFTTVEELKRAAYAHADALHTAFMMTKMPDEDPVLSLGLNYIRFAISVPRLFRFLFQSGYANERSLDEMIDSEEILPVLDAMAEGAGLPLEKTKQVFLTVGVFTHGYACLIANNGLDYDEATVAEHLTRAFEGAMMAAMSGEAATPDEGEQS